MYKREGCNNGMFSRIETFLSKFNLERKYEGNCIFNDVLEHDYSNGYKQLEKEKEKVLEYLKKAIE